MSKDAIISLRMADTDQTAIKDAAARHGLTVSDLLRIGADLAGQMRPDELRAAVACPTCAGSGRRFGGAKAMHQHPAWTAGVRWAAAEADAQAAGREPVYILDISDHLRICAEKPDRGSAVPRDRAPAGHEGDD